MGYCIHITRAPKWHHKNVGYEIRDDEWKKIIQEDPELIEEGSSNSINDRRFTAWLPLGADGAWLELSDGNIYSKNPPAALIEKMVQIAKRLDARVQGDDGETYLAGGKVLRAPR